MNLVKDMPAGDPSTLKCAAEPQGTKAAAWRCRELLAALGPRTPERRGPCDGQKHQQSPCMITKKKKKEIVFLTQVQKLISMEVSHIVALYKFPIAYAKFWSKYRR